MMLYVFKYDYHFCEPMYQLLTLLAFLELDLAFSTLLSALAIVV